MALHSAAQQSALEPWAEQQALAMSWWHFQRVKAHDAVVMADALFDHFHNETHSDHGVVAADDLGVL